MKFRKLELIFAFSLDSGFHKAGQFILRNMS